MKRQLGSLRRGSKLNINIGLKGRGSDVGDWSHMIIILNIKQSSNTIFIMYLITTKLS